MIVHAFSAYLAPVSTEDNRRSVEETVDYWYYVEEQTPNAGLLIAGRYDEYADREDVATTQYRIDVPAEVAERHRANVSGALHEFMDELEWELDWKGAPVIRQNTVAAELRKAAEERAAERTSAAVAA